MDVLINFVYPELSLMNPATFTIATLTTVTTLYLYFIQPSMLVQAYFRKLAALLYWSGFFIIPTCYFIQFLLRVAVRWSGMRMKYTKPLPDNFKFFYGEKGYKKKGQMSILLLHGFSADHFMWAPIVQNLPSYVHVVAMDLPGHGFTSDPIKGEDIGFKGQISRIKQFLELINLTNQPLHVVGVSMGATIAGILAAEFPENIAALTLTCPSMKTPLESRMIKENKKDVLEKDGGLLTLENCPMLPQTAKELQNMLDISHYYTVKYPQQILKGAVELRKKKNDLYLQLVNLLISEDSSIMLEKHLHRITCPVQVIWGQEDWVVDVSGLEILSAMLPNCQRIDILPECGHAVNLDQPVLFAEKVLEFWRQQNTQNEPLMCT